MSYIQHRYFYSMIKKCWWSVKMDSKENQMNKKYFLSLALVALVSAAGLKAADDGIFDHIGKPSKTAWDLSLRDGFDYFSNLKLKDVPLLSKAGRKSHALISTLFVAALARLGWMNKDKINDKVVKPVITEVKRLIGMAADCKCTSDCTKGCDTDCDKSKCAKRAKDWKEDK